MHIGSEVAFKSGTQVTRLPFSHVQSKHYSEKQTYMKCNCMNYIFI